MSNEKNRFELLEQITALDFVLVDLNLYLNTHPMDKEAVGRFNALVAQANTLKQNYERMFGKLTATGSGSPYPWQWINEPWPWEYEANFRFSGEER